MNHFLFDLPEKILPNNEVDKINEPIEPPSDLIRIIDQPVVYTEGCIAAGCPEGLW